MAIVHVQYYEHLKVTSGGRITIPQKVRDDLRLVDGDDLTVRVESIDGGRKQFTVWKADAPRS